MTESSLRDRVQNAVQAYLDSLPPTPVMPDEIPAVVVTDVVFEAMSGARPCVTCGKGIGPAKVGKGYVQCYDCNRRRVEVLPGPVTIQLKPTTVQIFDTE